MDEDELACLADGIYAIQVSTCGVCEGRGTTYENEPCKWCHERGKIIEFVPLKKEVLE